MADKLEAKEKAETQNISKIYQDGKMVYTTNVDDVRKANQELSETKRQQEYANRKKFFEEQEEYELKLLDERSEKLDEYGEKWSNIADLVTDEEARKYAAQLIGLNWEQDIINQRESTYQKFANEYYRIDSQIQGYYADEIKKLEDARDSAQESCDEQVKALQDTSDALEENKIKVDEWAAKIAEAFVTGEQSAVNSVLSYFNTIDGWKADNFINEFNRMFEAMNSNVVIDNANTAAKNALNSIATLNSKSISEDVSSNGTGTGKASSGHRIGDIIKTNAGYYEIDGITDSTHGGGYTSHKLTTEEIKKYGLPAYANGTDNAKKGLSIVDEDKNNFELVNFSGGEHILNNADTLNLMDNLGDIARSNLLKQLEAVPTLAELNGNLLNPNNLIPTNTNVDKSINISDITIEDSANLDEAFQKLKIMVHEKVNQKSRNR